MEVVNSRRKGGRELMESQTLVQTRRWLESEKRGAVRQGKKSSRGADIDLLPERLIEQ